jgi:beta-mannosidase
MAFATFSVAGAIVARNRLFMPRFHELEFAPADIRCRIENGEAIFECDVFAWGVCLDLEGNSELSDNFFDLYPGMPHRIHWHDGKAVEIVNVGNKLAETSNSKKESSLK